MKEKVERELGQLYQGYGQTLARKADLETEIRIRQGILNLLAQEEAEKAKQAEEEKAEDAE